MFGLKFLVFIAILIAFSLLFVDLHLQLVDDAQQVQLDHVVLKFIVFISELSLQSLDIQLC